MLDWQTIVAIIASLIALAGFAEKLTGKALSRYEHEEFKTAMREAMGDLRSRVERLEDQSIGK